MQQRSLVYSTLLGGIVAGTIDIGAAALIYQVSPVVIARAIAAGLLGPASFHGGWQTAALGVLLQWLMSCIIAGIFVIAAQRIASLKTHWIAAGLAYGVLVYVVMNFVVVPLSKAHPNQPVHLPTLASAAENLAAMFLFALIVSFFAKDSVRQTAGR
jgi:uncharacterized membrane protein YagU involved in acid resistance